jgi:predicted HAD superfamily Cof-like phosphohydrolase
MPMNSEELQTAFSGGYAMKSFDAPTEDDRNSYERVREFMEKFGHPVYDTPQLIDDPAWEQMRLDLIEEEFNELKDAVKARDLVGIADALGDLEYVVNGMALGCGIDLPAVVKEIHRSNMTKLGPNGKPIYREDGKILKGADYEPPNLERVLFE